jgi:hypothetical protein
LSDESIQAWIKPPANFLAKGNRHGSALRFISKGAINVSEMGGYCKAYLASSLRAYPGWKENPESLRQPETNVAVGKGPEKRTQLKDDDIVYLQENYFVTDDIFRDQNIIFDDVTEEWRQFCIATLNFAVPEEASAMAANNRLR